MKKYLIIILCLTSMVFGINKRYIRPQVSTVGLVAHYKLWASPTSSTTVFDYSLNGYTGTLSGGTGIPLPKYPGFDFVGASTQYIDVGACYNGVKTMSFWFNPDSIAGNDYMLDLNATDYIYTITGTVTLGGFAGITNIIYVDAVAAATTIVAGKWNLITVTSTTARNASNFDIGRVLGILYTNGVISDVRLYSTVLTSLEIKSIFELTRWRYSK